MRPAVMPGFRRLTAEFEGGQQTNHMYLDVAGLVTTAFGVLIDPVSAALACPWVKPDGSPASAAEVVAAWNRVKALQNMKLRGGMVFRPLTNLRLTEECVELVVGRKLQTAEQAMRRRFDGWDDYGADAQLFSLSMCWAIGPGWPIRFPRCADAYGRSDFLAAAEEAHISDEGNPGIKPRNKANRVLLHNASVVASASLLPDRLWWPRDILEEPLSLEDDTLDDDEPTVRSVITWDTVTRLPGGIANDDTEPPEAA